MQKGLASSAKNAHINFNSTVKTLQPEKAIFVPIKNSHTVKRIQKITGDGSSSLYFEGFGEHYHSEHGAVQESMHIFIDAGLKLCHQKPLHVLEMGLGTGLNCLLTWLQKPAGQKVVYHSIEAYPLMADEVATLNFDRYLELDEEGIGFFEQLHQSSWNEFISLTPNFMLFKHHNNLAETELAENFFHLVYYDAFSPASQPELWTAEVFAKIRRTCVMGAKLVTYCAKGQVRRNLIEAGFEVERIPGPPGKRQMMRATAI